MASNKIPGSRSGLMVKVVLAREGCESLQNGIGLMHSSAAILDGALISLEQKESAALDGRTARTAAYTACQLLDEQGSTLLLAVSNALRIPFGSRFSEAWQQTGWPGQSVSVPGTQDERLALLRRMKVFFTKNPGYEVSAQKITAARCDELYDGLVAARSKIHDCESDAETKQNDLEKAEAFLREKLQDLIAELTRLLSGSDARWLRFGLNLPDAPEVPDVPKNVAVDSHIPGKLVITCEASPGAQHYRFWKQVHGVDAHPVAAGSAQEPTFILEGLPAGAAVKVFVSAVNVASGESSLSAPAEGASLAAVA